MHINFKLTISIINEVLGKCTIILLCMYYTYSLRLGESTVCSKGRTRLSQSQA